MSIQIPGLEILQVRAQLDAELRARRHVVDTASIASRNLMNILFGLYQRTPEGGALEKDILAAHAAACALVEFLGTAMEQLDAESEKGTTPEPEATSQKDCAETCKTIH